METGVTHPVELYFQLFGSFSVEDSAGKDAAPNGTKAKALIPLLLTSPNYSRPRQWLQDMLWSTRGPDQRAASLRQCLVELRRTWAAYPDLIQADRQQIWLDPARVSVLPAENGIFLEDISVRDPAFAAWLGLQRLQHAQPSPAVPIPRPAAGPQKRDVAIATRHDQDHDAMLLDAAVYDVLAQVMDEKGTLSLVHPKVLESRPPDRLITLETSRMNNDSVLLRAVLEAPETSRVLQTCRRIVPATGANATCSPALLSFCNQVAEAACLPDVPWRSAGASPVVDPDLDLTSLISQAVTSIFSIRREQVQSAVDTLARLAQDTSHAVLYGWLAQAYTIQYVERYVPADAELRERCEEACRKALAGGAQNSIILAAVANARTNISRNYHAGLHLAEQSVKVNPGNPLAWWANSNALQCVGRTENAYYAARNAQALAEGTYLQFWTDFQVSLTASMLGRDDIAIYNGESAAALAPDFRPPLRYLTALYAMVGDVPSMTRTSTALQLVEQDFSLTQMIEDRDYPIGIMRRYGRPLTRALRESAQNIGQINP